MCDHEGQECPGRGCGCVCMNCPGNVEPYGDGDDWLSPREAELDWPSAADY